MIVSNILKKLFSCKALSCKKLTRKGVTIAVYIRNLNQIIIIIIKLT